MLGPTSRALITVVRGCWLAGLTSMVLPLPMRMGSLDEFIASTRARIRHGDAKLLLVDDLFARRLRAGAGRPADGVAVGACSPGRPAFRAAMPTRRHRPTRSGSVILQYTSGSTSEPKGVMIPDRVLSANIDAIAEAGRPRRTR